MAKKSLMDFELYPQGETGAIRARMRGVSDASKILATAQDRAFIQVAKGNHISKECSARVAKAFGEDTHSRAKGKAMRSCLRGEGVAQVGNKIRAALGSRAV